MNQYKNNSFRVKLTLTKDEWEKWSRLAKEESNPLATYLKRCCSAYIEKSFVFPKRLDLELQQFTFVIRGFGKNINQIARVAYQRNDFKEEEFIKLKMIVRNVEHATNRFLKHIFQSYADNHIYHADKVDES